MPRLPAMLLAVLFAALLAGCGSEEQEQPGDAGALLSDAFQNRVESGRASMSGKLELDGLPLLGEGIDFRVGGPFSGREADLDVTVGGFGPGLTGGLTVAGGDLYVTLAGRAYRLGGDVLRELMHGRASGEKPDFRGWLRDARIEGDGEVDGEPVTEVAAELDLERALADIERLTARDGARAERLGEFARFVEEAAVRVHVAKSDRTIRRLLLDVEFEVPEAKRGELAGTEGGALALDLTLTEVGEPQRIRPPADARPFEELLRQFGLDMELFRQ